MGKNKPLFDQRCLDLARHFAPHASEDRLADLARHIQTSVEDWLGDEIDHQDAHATDSQ